jgi:hypothetical protein
MEAAAELVADPAVGHGVQRVAEHRHALFAREVAVVDED